MSDDRHEVRVPLPAGNDMLMQVGGYPRAGGSSLVNADVESSGLRDLCQDSDGPLGEFCHLTGLLWRGVDISADMTVGAHQ